MRALARFFVFVCLWFPQAYERPFFERAAGFPGTGLAGGEVEPIEARRPDSRKAGVISNASLTDFESPRSSFERSTLFNNAK